MTDSPASLETPFLPSWLWPWQWPWPASEQRQKREAAWNMHTVHVRPQGGQMGAGGGLTSGGRRTAVPTSSQRLSE